MRRNSSKLNTAMNQPIHKLSNVDHLSRKEPYQRRASYHERKGRPGRFQGKQMMTNRVSRGFTDFKYNQDLVNNDYQHQFIKERVKVLNRIDDKYQEKSAINRVKLPKVVAPWDRDQNIRATRRRSVFSGYMDHSAAILPYDASNRASSKSYAKIISYANPKMMTLIDLPPIPKTKKKSEVVAPWEREQKPRASQAPNKAASTAFDEPWLS